VHGSARSGLRRVADNARHTGPSRRQRRNGRTIGRRRSARQSQQVADRDGRASAVQRAGETRRAVPAVGGRQLHAQGQGRPLVLRQTRRPDVRQRPGTMRR